MARVLYISYDGMLEPLGKSQVIGYLEKLARDNDISLVSFEKAADRADGAQMDRMRERLRASGIRWTPLAYHKSPSVPATVYDIAAGTAVALRIAVTRRIQIVHARSYVAAMMALSVKRTTGARFLFDMRGFWADERVDGNIWPAQGRVYRTVKGLERRFFRGADHLVTLTHASRRLIAEFDYLRDRDLPITVIPTCADLDRFSPDPSARDERFTFGYVGSIGTWYLFDETLAFFREIVERRPDARLLVVNRNEHAMIREAVARAGIDAGRLEMHAADHAEVPGHVRRMHVAASLIRPCFSKLASAPTKLAEYLGCGVPCLGNTGVGDMEETLEGNAVGVALSEFDDAALSAGAERLLRLADDPRTAGRCRETAERLFSLEGGATDYREIYARLAER